METPVNRLKVGLVGCGNIGADICIGLERNRIPADIVALTDIDPSRAKVLIRSFQLGGVVCSLGENAAIVDLLVECADAAVVEEVVEACIEHQTDCLILSVGALMSNPELFERAKKSGIKVHIPAGALCGLDGIQAAMEAGLHYVELTTRKPPQGLAGAPYLEENGIDVEDLDEPLVVFEGSALEAVKAFPQSVNVAASLSFAGIGPKETRVRVIADPDATLNTHEVVAEGAFGRLRTVTENLPSPRNAKSSYLASLSACACIRAAAEAMTPQAQAARPAMMAANSG